MQSKDSASVCSTQIYKKLSNFTFYAFEIKLQAPIVSRNF